MWQYINFYCYRRDRQGSEVTAAVGGGCSVHYPVISALVGVPNIHGLEILKVRLHIEHKSIYVILTYIPHRSSPSVYTDFTTSMSA